MMDVSALTPADAERVLLGSLLLDRDAIRAAEGRLTPEHFTDTARGLVYQAMLACHQQSEPPDPASVAAELRRRGELEAAGGIAALGELTAVGGSAIYVAELALRVAESGEATCAPRA